MELDLGTALIGLILTLAFVVPVIILFFSRSKRENKMLAILNETAAQHNCKINHYEFRGDFVLGIDGNRNFVFFLKQKKQESISQYVDLSQIQKCEVINKSKELKSDKTSIKFIERLELCFTPKNQNLKETKFELYDAELNTQLNGELQFADQWSKRIIEHLKKNG